jgi:hypothetical protein
MKSKYQECKRYIISILKNKKCVDTLYGTSGNPRDLRELVKMNWLVIYLVIVTYHKSGVRRLGYNHHHLLQPILFT